MHKIKWMILLLLLLLLVACSRIDTMTKTIDSIESNQVSVNCSDEVNGNKINVNSIGYDCTVLITEETVLSINENTNATIEDFNVGDQVRIHLKKPINIQKERTFEAKEIYKIN